MEMKEQCISVTHGWVFICFIELSGCHSWLLESLHLVFVSTWDFVDTKYAFKVFLHILHHTWTQSLVTCLSCAPSVNPKSIRHHTILVIINKRVCHAETFPPGSCFPSPHAPPSLLPPDSPTNLLQDLDIRWTDGGVALLVMRWAVAVSPEAQTPAKRRVDWAVRGPYMTRCTQLSCCWQKVILQARPTAGETDRQTERETERQDYLSCEGLNDCMLFCFKSQEKIYLSIYLSIYLFS